MKQTIKILTLFFIVTTGYAQDEIPELFEFNISTLQGLYFIDLVLINNTPIESEDWVGVFNGNTCVGAKKWNTTECGGGICSINVMGDDGTSIVDTLGNTILLTEGYMLPGDIPTFKIYDASEDIYYEAESNSEICNWEFLVFCDIEQLSYLGPGGCTDIEACNYDSNAAQDNGTCEYAETNYDCDGSCIEYIDIDGNCCLNDEVDICGVCNGNGIIQECGCGTPGEFGIPEGDCDCYGNVLDCNGECNGEAIIDCNGECNGGTTDCDINISFNYDEFENLVLFANLYPATDWGNNNEEEICINENISFLTTETDTLNINAGECIYSNNQGVIPIYISNQFYITNFNLSLTGFTLEASQSGAVGGLFDYINYGSTISLNNFAGWINGGSLGFITGLTSNCMEPESCNPQDVDINDENLCVFPVPYWFDLDSDGLGFGDSVEYCENPNGWVLNNDDDCPEDPENDQDGDGLCACFSSNNPNCDPFPECFDNYFDCSGECGGTAVIDDCDICDGGNADDVGCGCFQPAALEYWYDEDGDGLGNPEEEEMFCEDDVPYGWVLNNDDLEPNCSTNDTDHCGVCAGGGIDDLGCGCFNSAALEYCIDSDGDLEGNSNPETWIDLCYDEYANYTDILIPVASLLCTDDDEDCIGSFDECGICDGNDYDKDCNGDCFGNAQIDYCGICSGGLTQLEVHSCATDSNNDGICDDGWEGPSFDDCGVCNGANYDNGNGLIVGPDSDCNGECFGDAEFDDCNVCDGDMYLDADGDLYNGLYCDCGQTQPNNCEECIETPCDPHAFFPALIDNDFKSSIEVPIYLNGYANNTNGFEGLDFEFTYNSNYYDLNDVGITINDELANSGYILTWHDNGIINDSLNIIKVEIHSENIPLLNISDDIVTLNFNLNNQDNDYSYLNNKTTNLNFEYFRIGNESLNEEDISNGTVQFKTIMCLDSFASNFCDVEEPDFPSLPIDECIYYNNQQNYIITDGLCEYIVEIEISEDGTLLEDLLLTNGNSSIELFIDSETVIIQNDNFDGEISFSELYSSNELPIPSSDNNIPLILWGNVVSFEPYELIFQDETGQVTINIEFDPFEERGILEYDLYKLDDLDDLNWERVEIQSCGENACQAQINSFGLYSVVIGGLGCINPDACNFNKNAVVDDGSCFFKEEFGQYCYDSDDDGLGYAESSEDYQYFCPEAELDGWVNNCSDLEPDCPTNNTDDCGVCGGDNQCYDYPESFISTWILTEQNQFIDPYCFEDDGNPAYLGPFNGNFNDEDGSPFYGECITYKMILNYLEPCEWIDESCKEIDNSCSQNNEESICTYNPYCIWESGYCVETNNNCKNIDNEFDCNLNIDYSNSAQLICVIDETYDDEFGGGWLYDEIFSDTFEWGVKDNQLCFNTSYGLNDYECINYALINEDNELRLQYVVDEQCSQNTFIKNSYLSVSSNPIPNKYKLYEIYPNPFNPSTNITFDIPKASYVSLNIYNINGQLVDNIINQYLPSGHYKFHFDGKNLSSGIYFAVLHSDMFSQSNKMLLIK